MKINKKIAVVDDDIEMGRLVKDILIDEGHEVESYTSVSEALVKFKTQLPDVVVTDLKMKEIDGMMLLKKLRDDYPNLVTIMMTAFGSIDTAIEAMKNGAYHYIVKPFKNEEMVLLVQRALERSKLTQENKILKNELKKTYSLDSIIGKSAAIQEVFEMIKRIANASATVLVTGESGTGKELIAHAVHNLGPRKGKAFVPVNCSAIPEQLLESELFGHVKGSFTGATGDKKGLFEEANNGTIFLDEIGDLSSTLQAKLLRVLQDKQIRPVGDNKLKQIDVRIIAATHRDLATMVKDGKFREDLFYRLQIIPIRVPSLRERPEDIPLLAEAFIKKFAAQNNSNVTGISPEAMAVLMAHPWPGNVRELEGVLERAVILSRSPTIEEKDILKGAVETAKGAIEKLFEGNPTLDKLEEAYIKRIMGQVNFEKDKAAKILGVSRRTLYRKEREYGMVSSDVPEPTEE
jgi:DNA-binding NtrC family response regulator